MRLEKWRWVLAAALLASSAHAQNRVAPERRAFDKMFEDTAARYRLPGLALGVIENGEVVYVRTTGELMAGGGEPITPDTLFKIASNSKAMTTALLARLVDAGKLNWDDPVVKHLPGFRLHDPWVTREIQVRDLLIHNSGLGLGAGDLMLWPEPNGFTRADVLAGLAHLKPTHSFRSHYAYDNILYIVAGEVAAAAGGASYESLLQRELFTPLRMDRCQAGGFDREAIGNIAQPHLFKDGRNLVIRVDETQVPTSTSAAAGGIRCSLNDMLRWAGAWLAPDVQQRAWLSDAQRAALWTPHMPLPLSAQTRAWEDANFFAYGYGWRLSDANGKFKVAHTGTLAGMYSVLTLLPERRTGFVILINGNGAEARVVLNQVLLDRYTNANRRRDVAWYADDLARVSDAAAVAAPKVDTSSRRRARARALATRLGIYRDPWFGEVAVCADGRHVGLASQKSPRMAGRVMRVGDRVLVDWHDDSVDAEAWLDFDLSGADGAIAMKWSHVDPAADFSYDYADLEFSRVRDCD